jgi:ABC-2 type transport system ATP-binding protein
VATTGDRGGTGGAAIEVEHLVRRYGDFTAVDDVSFSVEPGELFGFLGPNGAGKTTTISILCTLRRPSGGIARVAGYDVATQRDRVRANIGLVFQEITLDDYLTAAENLRFHAVMYGVPSRAIDERMLPLLEMVGLMERKDQLVGQFSGGMKRRLEIARGLLHAPRVLFLDEPTIGLDPQTRIHIWDYVDELRRREQTTMFLTTHYMDEAERCDRIAIIDSGRIIAIDTPNALKASVGADTVTLVTADDELAVTQISERLHVTVERDTDQLVVRIADGESFVPKIFAAIDVPVRSVNVRRPSLDDVFIKYTGHEMRDSEQQRQPNAVARAHRSR